MLCSYVRPTDLLINAFLMWILPMCSIIAYMRITDYLLKQLAKHRNNICRMDYGSYACDITFKLFEKLL